MKDRAWEDEFTLLCERCGYVVEGLDPAGNCPECGKPIAESLPEQRVGTAWQQAPSLRTYLLTALSTLLSPMRTLDAIRVNPENGRMLAAWHHRIATIIVGVVLLIAVAWVSSNTRPANGIDWKAVVLVELSAASIAICIAIRTGLPILTFVETRGLIFLSRRRGSRVTPAMARSITSHGGIGWVIAAFGGVVGLTVSFLAFSRHIDTVYATPSLWAGIAFTLAGFLFFETFAWLGLRRCKFANRARPSTTIGA